MSNKQKPSHRVSFCGVVGKDEAGQDKLGPAREIGAIWPRKTGNGSILRFDIIPVEMTLGQGVVFIHPIDTDA